MPPNLEQAKAPPLKILYLTGYDPAGQDNGGVVRTRNILQLLSRLGQVRLVLAGDFQDETVKAHPSPGGFELVDAVRFQSTGPWSFYDRLRNEFDPRFLNPDRTQARPADVEKMQQLMAEHDLVWIHNLRLADRYGLWRWPHSVLDIDDLPSGQYRNSLAQAVGLAEKLRGKRQVRLWRRREIFLLERFDALCVCSEPDRKNFAGADRVFVLPNAFAAPAQPPVRNPATPPRVGFIGDFRHAPNRQGMQWFVENTWPRLLEKIPAARLRVIGKDGAAQTWLAQNNIDALGWVADTQSEMATWSLTVVPIFSGGGTRVKIAEAFSRQCPVVATSLGAYGYDVTDGRELLLADSAENFTTKCLEILSQPPTGRKLAENAWKKFNENWTWDKQAERIDRIVQTVLKKSA
jgi:glycosyltransferase involved in cell wall biosynthesis